MTIGNKRRYERQLEVQAIPSDILAFNRPGSCNRETDYCVSIIVNPHNTMPY